jgi:NADPH2:quinone reductase
MAAFKKSRLMRAAVCREYGAPVRIEDVKSPLLRTGEVRVEIHAAGVNFSDVLVLQNRYQIPASLPFIPGSEIAGIVREVGPGVSGISVGDRVTAQMLVGAFAEEVALPASSTRPLPATLDVREAAAFGVAFATAYYALRSAARLRAAQSVLVLGAGGGIGLAAVEIARVLGARVIAAASSEGKLAVCRERGAHEVVDYVRDDLKERVKALTDGRGVDVVIDPVGGKLAELAIRATAWRGRYVCLGFASGEIPRIPLNLLLLKGPELCALNIGTFAANEPQEAARNDAELATLVREGRLRPHVSAIYPLEEAAAALAHVAERRAIGKVVIEMRAASRT